MLRLILFLALVSFLEIGCDSTLPNAVDESAEPALKYTVKLGEKTVTISEGETVKLDGTFTEPELTITPELYRVFAYQGITFKYPRSFGFEAGLQDPNAKHWILSGNDFKLSYFALNEPLSAAALADEMIGKFGRKNAKVVNANASILLGQQKLTGTSLRVSVATHSMVLDIYQIPSQRDQARLLVFQDNLDDAGKHSQEGTSALALIESSFTVEP